MSSNGGAVAKLLGFIPTDFYNEIASSIDTQIDNQIENFTKELLTIAKSKAYKSVTKEKLDECSDKLRKRMRVVYGGNMEKFGSYADRNCFVQSKKPAVIAEDKKSKTDLINIELTAVSTEVDLLREEYLLLRSTKDQLASECKDGDSLLKDMRKTLFTIRVGAQELQTIQPIVEIIAVLEDHKKSLCDFNQRAKDLNTEMIQFCAPEETREGEGESSSGGQIADVYVDLELPVTGDQQDLNILRRNFQNEKNP
mmetsp:Transcript_34802/g.33116  ORF Transcript_34802/g.33116 Transcript_34802/m.33116 type:complete len:254 (+) Transcript_34802:143-904(+)|eukprot:CAMPEP_0119037158 /NCGR_PEP_ID=MMETSP1177-20130426/5341_1 /TAXON_ID=2985 /ORGANISM="Ochromonas sp, Strain CCMP1899" /LENGTH=253 /DNA_ID=CAMNT_0006998031 /DNA_START=90 /DNA_END=851 /DNA_ORIENTATION=+